jgi:hypothetical protein
MRGISVSRDEMLKELGQHTLPDLISSVQARQKAWRAAMKKDPAAKPKPPSRTEQEIDRLLGSREAKARLAATSPPTVAKLVEEIHRERPAIKAYFAERGLSVEDGTWLMCQVLAYTTPRDWAAFVRRTNKRGGVLWEFLMAFEPEAVAVERKVALDNAVDWIREEPARFGIAPKDVEKFVSELKLRFAQLQNVPAQYGRGIARSQQIPGIGEIDFLAPNLWLMRLTEIRDEAGRLMMDHERALVSFSPTSIEVTPVGVGESKFGSKAAELFRQLIANVGRSKETLRAANLPDPSALPVNVRWGKRLAVIAQTESVGKARTPADLQASLSKKAGRQLNITPAVVGTNKGAETSREVVGEFMRLLGFGFD